MNYQSLSYLPSLDDFQPGSLFHLKNENMQKTKPNGETYTPKHFLLLLKNSSDWKKYLMLPLTSSSPMSGKESGQKYWKLPSLSKSFYLPSPWDSYPNMNGQSKPTYSSLNLMEWLTEDQLLQLGESGSLKYLTYLEEDEWKSFMDKFSWDLYQNMPLLKWQKDYYLKLQKSFESDGQQFHSGKQLLFHK